MIKINAKKLNSFVKRATMNASATDVKLEFTKEGLIIQGKNDNATALAKGILKPHVFEEIEEIEISLSSTQTLIQTLSAFGNTLINIVVEENYMKVMDIKSNVMLVTAKTVNCSKEVKFLELDKKFVLMKDDVSTFLDRNQKISESPYMLLSNKDKKATLYAEGDLHKVEVITPSESDDVSELSLSVLLFSNVVSLIDTPNINVRSGVIKDLTITCIDYETEDETVNYIIAPLDIKRKGK